MHHEPKCTAESENGLELAEDNSTDLCQQSWLCAAEELAVDPEEDVRWAEEGLLLAHTGRRVRGYPKTFDALSPAKQNNVIHRPDVV